MKPLLRLKFGFYILIIGVILFFASRIIYYYFTDHHQDVSEVASLVIRFNGYKSDFAGKHHLYYEIEDEFLAKEIVSMWNASEKLFMCSSVRPVAWAMDVWVEKKNGEEDYLFSIDWCVECVKKRFQLLEGEVICYKNDSLVFMLKEMLKVDEIGAFNGSMTQEDYNRIIEKE